MKILLTTIFAGFVFCVILLFLSKSAMPDTQLYNFKRMYEKARMALIFDRERKAEYHMYLLDERFREIDYVTRKQKYDMVLSTSLRYSTTVGDAVSYVNEKQLKQYISPLKQKLSRHKEAFVIHERTVSTNGGQRLFLQDAINYIDMNTKLLSN